MDVSRDTPDVATRDQGLRGRADRRLQRHRRPRGPLQGLLRDQTNTHSNILFTIIKTDDNTHTTINQTT